MRPLLLTLASFIPGTLAQVTGITDGINPDTGERPVRKNIDDLYAQGGPEWDLYIQAMISMQKTKEDDLFSYYQIAGIHGLPFKGWNGVGNVPGGSTQSGFCLHGQINFIIWHRPYVALFEQTLHSHAREIAKRYSGDELKEYQDAVNTLRVPFWDWAASPTLPKAATTPTFMINTSAGRVNLRNPLWSYQFQEFPFTDPSFRATLAQFNESKRCVNDGSNSDGISDFELADSELIKDNKIDQIYAVFTQSKAFDSMASSSFPHGHTFESPHNNIHNDVSCLNQPNRTGHMLDANWSAFDPLFFLHHANVDRLLAMWQAIYYNDSMFSSSWLGFQAYGTAKGNVTADSPLKPFKDANDAFWTSNGVRDIKTFGYTYPEIRDWELSAEDLRKAVTQKVNALYGSALPRAPTNTRRSRFGTMMRDPPPATTPPSTALLLKDYSAAISVDRAELTLPCSIELYLGSERGGVAAVLAMPASGVHYATVPLRRTLQSANVNLDSAQSVVDVLRQDLKLQIVSHDGIVTAAESVRSLTIEIEDRDFAPSESDDEFPWYGEVTRWSVDVASLG